MMKCRNLGEAAREYVRLSSCTQPSCKHQPRQWPMFNKVHLFWFFGWRVWAGPTTLLDCTCKEFMENSR